MKEKSTVLSKRYDKRSEHNLSSDSVKKGISHTPTISDRTTKLFIGDIFHIKTLVSNLTAFVTYTEINLLYKNI